MSVCRGPGGTYLRNVSAADDFRVQIGPMEAALTSAAFANTGLTW